MDVIDELRLLIKTLEGDPDIVMIVEGFGRDRGIDPEVIKTELNGHYAAHIPPVTADSIDLDWGEIPGASTTEREKIQAESRATVLAAVAELRQDRSRWSHSEISAMIDRMVRVRCADAEMNDFRAWCISHAGLLKTDFVSYEKAAKAKTQARETDGTLRLFKGKPMGAAYEFAARECTSNGVLMLRHWRGAFYWWTGTHYKDVDKDAIEGQLWHFMYTARTLDTNLADVKFEPTSSFVDDTLNALRAVAGKEVNNVDAPFWITGDTANVIAVKNGLLRTDNWQLMQHTPNYFNLGVAEVAYDALAKLEQKSSRWLKLMDEAFPGDQQSIDCLQEIMGYILTTDTSQQKIFALIGTRRAGKGTILRIMQALLGMTNYTATTLGKLAGSFSLESMIGKSACFISDAQMSGRFDSAAIAEQLKSISGEDAVSVARKYKSDWVGQLKVRFILAANELLSIADKSGALASRLILLKFEQSFLGKEDTKLDAKLRLELSGIMNWSLRGLLRLQQRGHFVQPETSSKDIEAVEKLGSPVMTFISECYEIGQGLGYVAKDTIYVEYTSWCQRNNLKANSKEMMCRDLLAAYGDTVKRVRPMTEGWKPGDHGPKQYQAFTNIRTLSANERIEK